MHPQSVSPPQLEQKFAERVLACVILDEGWRPTVPDPIPNEGTVPDNNQDIRRIDAAVANFRKQHVWDVMDDQEFETENQIL